MKSIISRLYELDNESIKESLKCEILSYILMKANLFYAGLLASVLLVLVASGPSTFATITESTQPPGTTDQSDGSEEAIVTVAIGEGSNETIQTLYVHTTDSRNQCRR